MIGSTLGGPGVAMTWGITLVPLLPPPHEAIRVSRADRAK